MSSNFVESIMAEMAESALYNSEDKEGVETILKNTRENDEHQVHDAVFSILIRHCTKEELAHHVAFRVCERAQEYS